MKANYWIIGTAPHMEVEKAHIIFLPMVAVALVGFISLGVLLGCGDRAVAGLKSGKKAHFIAADDTTKHQIILDSLAHRVTTMPNNEGIPMKVLMGRVEIRRPKQVCIEGITPLAGISTLLLYQGKSEAGFLVNTCIEADSTPATFTLLVAVPDNLDTDAVLISNR